MVGRPPGTAGIVEKQASRRPHRPGLRSGRNGAVCRRWIGRFLLLLPWSSDADAPHVEEQHCGPVLLLIVRRGRVPTTRGARFHGDATLLRPTAIGQRRRVWERQLHALLRTSPTPRHRRRGPACCRDTPSAASKRHTLGGFEAFDGHLIRVCAAVRLASAARPPSPRDRCPPASWPRLAARRLRAPHRAVDCP